MAGVTLSTPVVETAASWSSITAELGDSIPGSQAHRSYSELLPFHALQSQRVQERYMKLPLFQQGACISQGSLKGQNRYNKYLY